MDSGNFEEMGEAVLAVRPVREVLRDAGWPERFVATVPDVTLGAFVRWVESPGPPPLRPLGLPPQWSVCGSMSAEERSRLFDPVENAEAAIRRYQARQSETLAAGLRYIRARYGWETYSSSGYRQFVRWPLSLSPASPHGDPMASDIGRR